MIPQDENPEAQRLRKGEDIEIIHLYPWHITDEGYKLEDFSDEELQHIVDQLRNKAESGDFGGGFKMELYYLIEDIIDKKIQQGEKQ